MGVGDNQGNTYKTGEGYGRAYILPKSEAIEQLPDQLDQYFAIEAQKDAAGVKAAALQDAKDKQFKQELAKLEPDWWSKHDAELRGTVDDVLNMGTEIYATGTDPLTSSDPTSTEFRKKLARATQLGKLSMQWKDYYDKSRALVNSDKGDTYDPLSAKELMDDKEGFFAKTTLNDALDQGLLPPNLRFKQPSVDLEKLARESAGGITKEGVPTQQDYFTIADGHISKPENQAKIQQFLGDMKQTQPEYYEANVATPAKLANVPEATYYMGTLIESFRPDKPLVDDIKTAVDKIALGTVTNAFSNENESGVTTSGETTLVSKESALAKGFLSANQNPGLVDRMVTSGSEYYPLERTKDGQIKPVPGAEPIKVVDKKTAGELLGYEAWLKTNYLKKTGKSRQFFSEAVKLGIGDEKEIEKDRDVYEKLLRGKVTTWEELAGYGLNVGKRKGAFTEEDIRRLQNWAVNQASGLSVREGSNMKISSNVPDIDPETGKQRIDANGRPVFITTTAVPLSGGVDERGAYTNGTRGLVVATMNETADKDGKLIQTTNSESFNLDETGAGQKDYLQSGVIDNWYGGIIKGEGKKKSKGRILPALEQDLYEIFLESETPKPGAYDIAPGSYDLNDMFK